MIISTQIWCTKTKMMNLTLKWITRGETGTHHADSSHSHFIWTNRMKQTGLCHLCRWISITSAHEKPNDTFQKVKRNSCAGVAATELGKGITLASPLSTSSYRESRRRGSHGGGGKEGKWENKFNRLVGGFFCLSIGWSIVTVGMGGAFQWVVVGYSFLKKPRNLLLEKMRQTYCFFALSSYWCSCSLIMLAIKDPYYKIGGNIITVLRGVGQLYFPASSAPLKCVSFHVK